MINTIHICHSLTTIDLGHNPLMTLDGNSKYAIGDLLKLNVSAFQHNISNIILKFVSFCCHITFTVPWIEQHLNFQFTQWNAA